MQQKVKSQQGQALMEYVIVSGLVGIMCLVAVKQFGSVIKQRVQDMKEQIVKNIDLAAESK